MKPLLVSVLLVITASSARAEPVSLRYTSFAHSAETESDKHWQQVFANEAEVTLHLGAFSGHVSIERPKGRQELAILYSERKCRDLKSGSRFAIAKCPARLITYSASGPESHQVDDICLLHKGGQYPGPDQFGYNDVEVRFESANSAPSLMVFAILDGATFSECSTKIPLDHP